MATHINYVWINEEKTDVADREVTSAINHTYIDVALENAKANPDANLNIWVDFKLLDPTSEFFLTSHLYLMGTSNVTLRNIRVLPDYDNDPIFDTSNPKDIWARVDYARVLVLKESLSEAEPDDLVIYSDFDAEDLALKDSELKRTLQFHDMAFAATIDGLENGFMAFKKTETNVALVHTLAQDSKKAAQANAKSRKALVDVICAHAATQGTKQTDYWGKRMPNMGDKMLPNSEYADLGLHG